MLILVLGSLVVILDQATKYAVRSRFALGDGLTVLPGLFDLRYIQNTGAAWGMLEGLSHWLIVLSVVMLAILIRFRHTFTTHSLCSRLALALMGAGIVGNLLDRVTFGYVVDFLDFYWASHHFPAFNVADSAICTGVGLYMLSTIRSEGRNPGSDPA
jgi:signal peptidase II